MKVKMFQCTSFSGLEEKVQDWLDTVSKQEGFQLLYVTQSYMPASTLLSIFYSLTQK